MYENRTENKELSMFVNVEEAEALVEVARLYENGTGSKELLRYKTSFRSDEFSGDTFLTRKTFADESPPCSNRQQEIILGL